MRGIQSIFIIFLLTFFIIGTPAFGQRDKKKKPEATSSAAKLREAEFFFTEGEKYFILEDYTKALMYFQRVAELNPGSATVHFKIAEILSKGSKQEDLERAAQAIEIALRLEKKNKYFYLLGANIFGSLLRFEDAERTIETMMQEVKGTEEYLFELAAFYLYDNKPDKALEVYNRAEIALGINETSSLQKQKILFEQGKVEDAIQEGQRLIEAYPDEERYVLGLAETLSQNKQAGRAISYIEKYLSENPDASNAKLLLAGLYRENGLEEKARTLLNVIFDDLAIDVGSKVLVLGTYNASLSQQAAKGTPNQEMVNFSRTLLTKLKSNYPNNPNVYLVGGDLNFTLKNNVLAQQDYLMAIQKGSSSFEAWQNLLYLESQMNQFDSLILHAEAGLELFPNQALLYYFNGYGHLRKRHNREAAFSLEQAKKLSSSNVAFLGEINGMLGDVYNGMREYEKSDLAYDQALAQNPNNDLVLNNYSYYLALRKDKLEKAEKMAVQLVKSHPDNASYLDTYAWVLFMREKFKDAKKMMERAIDTGDAGATHFEHYGDILFKLGDTNGAVQQWQKAKTLDSGNEMIDKKIANRRLY